jgi:hypothetical protein
MNSPSTLYAMLQVMAIVLIFLTAFLALFLCMILCLVAVEFSCAGVSFVRTKVAKRGSFHPLVASERQGHNHAAGRHVSVVH